MAFTTRNLLSEALSELNIVGVGQSMQAADADLALNKLHRLLDNWNAERAAVYADQFLTFTLAPNEQTRTIGPTGNWVTSQRPVRVDGLNVILNNVTPPVRTKVNVRDAAWWDALTVPEVTGTFPTDAYYSPDWPNGTFHLWPVPTVAYDFEIWCRIVLSQPGLDDTFTLPPGYRDAITLTLAEDLAPSYGVQVSSITQQKGQAARARIFANNDRPRYIITNDLTMPANGGVTPYFNYRTGEPL